LKTIKYKVDKKMQKVKIFVNEIEVTIKRDATKSVLDEDGKRKTIFTAGKSIKARFVVESWLMKTIILLPNGCF
ncbi:MAG: hypothetical protein Q9M36_13475, partial [Sulfurovum sp.]|nr:hypothetical protein [Sulfurovum sp.]